MIDKVSYNFIDKLKRNYNMTIEDYDLLVRNQGGVCLICGASPSMGGRNQKRLHIDHDHTNKSVRGLLCSNCNSGLGFFKENPTLLEAASKYLKKYRSGK